MSLYNILVRKISSEKWLDMSYNNKVTNYSILKSIETLFSKLQTINKCDTDWIPNIISIILATYLTGNKLIITYKPSYREQQIENTTIDNGEMNDDDKLRVAKVLKENYQPTTECWITFNVLVLQENN